MAGAKPANTVLVASATQPVSTTSSTPTSGRVTNQPIVVAQADIAPMAFDTKKVAVPMDPPPQAMDYRTPQPVQPVQAATQSNVLAYEAPNGKAVDAIGQMLLAQDRPNSL